MTTVFSAGSISRSGAQMKELEKRITRDQRNAELAHVCAQRELSEFRPAVTNTGGLHGATEHDKNRASYAAKRLAALKAIARDPFQVMVEVVAEVWTSNGDTTEKRQIWYANESSSANEVLSEKDAQIAVLSWTHPGIQVALSSKLGDCKDLRSNGYKLASVEPIARAKFDSTLPEISGIYQPGGAVRPSKVVEKKSGLKAVKLNMTPDQVAAFISKMSGLMIVTGAPGSGKTTVAFQRIRFLFDQQDERSSSERHAAYTPELTRVFLANENLAGQAKELLQRQLDVPSSVVESVANYVDSYLDQAWPYKHNARPRQKKLGQLEAAARASILGLSDHHDLGRLWKVYETQIAGRLAESRAAEWVGMRWSNPSQIQALASALSRVPSQKSPGNNPLTSRITMSAVYSEVSRTYVSARDGMSAQARSQFDEAFLHWIFWVYDPLDALASYFSGRETEAAHRMRQGTGGRVDEAKIIHQASEDWSGRVYGPEDRPWLAWLLRFALPEATDPQSRFREIPSAIAPATSANQRWTHIVVDEAQDLCVAEASLLGSLVAPDGALTVSADFRQVVSPVHGMRSPEAFNIGRSLRGKGAEQIYPFARNMRQSKQIGNFLRGFYEAAFKERPDFDVNPDVQDKKPQLLIIQPKDQVLRIKQICAVMQRSEVINSVALLQINEDELALSKLRADLEAAGVPLAAPWAVTGNGLLTNSVERIKGLEFDACIVLGLEGVESAALNFTLNRAYVALSRPSRRLALICSEFPPLLRKVDKSLFEIV
jgi:hypothetical protein